MKRAERLIAAAERIGKSAGAAAEAGYLRCLVLGLGMELEEADSFRRDPDLIYFTVHNEDLGSVTIGVEYEAEEPETLDEPGCMRTVNVEQVWLGGRDISVALCPETMESLNEEADRMIDARESLQ